MKDTTKLIGKYALLLAILYLVMFGFNLIMKHYSHELNYDSKALSPFIVFGMTIILNIIAALFINHDLKKMKIKANYIVFLTIIYRPIGIVLFLLNIINTYLVKNRNSVKE